MKQEHKQILLAIAVPTAIALYIWAAVPKNTQMPPNAPPPETAEQAKAREFESQGRLRMVQAERIVKGHLKDPKSATFRNLFYTGKAVCGEVNAKNGFGGYTGFQPFINRGTIVVMPEDPVFAEAWKEFCATK